MFDGKTFFEVAAQLRSFGHTSGKSDAFFRSSVSRAYYACFHAYRERHFPKEKWHIPKGGGEKEYISHRKLRKKVRADGEHLIADKLDLLVELREHADYHSWQPAVQGTTVQPPACYCPWGPDARGNSDLALDLARQLLEQLEKGVGTGPGS